MSILNLFKKLKPQRAEEPKFENTIAPETMLRTILEQGYQGESLIRKFKEMI